MLDRAGLEEAFGNPGEESARADRFRRWVTQALALQQFGDFDRALLIYQQAAGISSGPEEEAYVLNRMGDIHRELGHYSEAVELLRRAVQMQPQNATYWGFLARTYHQIVAAVQESPAGSLPEGLTSPGAAGWYEQARQAYEESLRLNPEQAICQHALGLVFMRTGKPVEAEERMRRAIRMDPDNTLYRRHLAGLLMESGDFESAAEQTRTVLELARGVAAKGNDTVDTHSLWVEYAEMRLFAQPQEHPVFSNLNNLLLTWKAVWELAGSEGSVPEALREASFNKGGFSEEQFGEILSAIAPGEDEEPLTEKEKRARLQLLGLVPAAIAHARQLQTETPEDVVAWALADMAMWYPGNLPKEVADKDLQEMVARAYEAVLAVPPDAGLEESDPVEARRLVARGEHFFKDGEIAKALNEFEEATRKDKDSLEAWISLGAAHVMNEDLHEALPAFRQAERINPNDVVVLRHLGATLYELGDYAEALRVFHRASGLEPSNADFWKAQGQICQQIALAMEEPDTQDGPSLPEELTAVDPGEWYLRAMQAYQTSLLKEPDQTEVTRYNLGTVLLRLGNYAGAAEQLLKAVLRKPDEVDYHRKLAEAYTHREHHGAAADHLQMAFELAQAEDAAGNEGVLSQIWVEYTAALFQDNQMQIPEGPREKLRPGLENLRDLYRAWHGVWTLVRPGIPVQAVITPASFEQVIFGGAPFADAAEAEARLRLLGLVPAAIAQAWRLGRTDKAAVVDSVMLDMELWYPGDLPGEVADEDLREMVSRAYDAGLEEQDSEDRVLRGLISGEVGAEIGRRVADTLAPILRKPGWKVEFETAIAALGVPERLPATHLVRGAAQGPDGRDWWMHLHLIQAHDAERPGSMDVRHGLLFHLELDPEGRVTGVTEVRAEPDPNVLPQNPFVSLEYLLSGGLLTEEELQALKDAGLASIQRHEQSIREAIASNRHQYALAQSVEHASPHTWLMVRVQNARGEPIGSRNAALLGQSGVYRLLDRPLTLEDSREFPDLFPESGVGLEEGPSAQQVEQALADLSSDYLETRQAAVALWKRWIVNERREAMPAERQRVALVIALVENLNAGAQRNAPWGSMAFRRLLGISPMESEQLRLIIHSSAADVLDALAGRDEFLPAFLSQAEAIVSMHRRRLGELRRGFGDITSELIRTLAHHKPFAMQMARLDLEPDEVGLPGGLSWDEVWRYQKAMSEISADSRYVLRGRDSIDIRSLQRLLAWEAQSSGEADLLPSARRILEHLGVRRTLWRALQEHEVVIQEVWDYSRKLAPEQLSKGITLGELDRTQAKATQALEVEIFKPQGEQSQERQAALLVLLRILDPAAAARVDRALRDHDGGADSGLEENALVKRWEEMRAAALELRAVVIGPSVAEQFPQLRVLAEMDDHFLIEEPDKRADTVLHLVLKEVRAVHYYGSWKEAEEFAPLAEEALIAVEGHLPTEGDFLAQLQQILLLAGIPRDVLDAGLEEFAAEMGSLAVGA